MKHRCRRTRNSLQKVQRKGLRIGRGWRPGIQKGMPTVYGEKGWEGWPGFPCEPRPARMRGRQECPLLTQGSKDHTSSGGGTAARTQILGNPLNFHQERLGLGEAGPHSHLLRDSSGIDTPFCRAIGSILVFLICLSALLKQVLFLCLFTIVFLRPSSVPNTKEILKYLLVVF